MRPPRAHNDDPDPMRLATLLSISSFLTSNGCGGGGTADDPITNPPAVEKPAARSGHNMAYDAARGVTLLFGGSGTTTYGDLWSWNGTRWTRLSTSGPPARDDGVLVYDSGRNRLVLFGGRSGSTLLADTWEWDGTAWSQKSGPAPDARLHAVAAYDATRGVVRLYGGVGSDDVPRTDTWEWNGTTWTRVSTTGPADRAPNHMAWDAGRQRTMLMLFDRTKPNGNSTYATDLWEWTGTAWQLVVGDGPAISPIQQVVGLGAAGGLLMFDGGVAQGAAATWVWQNGTWTRVSTSGPPLRNGQAIAYDAGRNRVVLFGGFRPGQSDFDDTWEWNGTAWAQVSPQ